MKTDLPHLEIEMYFGKHYGKQYSVAADTIRMANDDDTYVKLKHVVKFDHHERGICSRDTLVFDYDHAQNGVYDETMGIHPLLCEWAESKNKVWAFYDRDMIILKER